MPLPIPRDHLSKLGASINLTLRIGTLNRLSQFADGMKRQDVVREFLLDAIDWDGEPKEVADDPLPLQEQLFVGLPEAWMPYIKMMARRNGTHKAEWIRSVIESRLRRAAAVPEST